MKEGGRERGRVVFGNPKKGIGRRVLGQSRQLHRYRGDRGLEGFGGFEYQYRRYLWHLPRHRPLG